MTRLVAAGFLLILVGQTVAFVIEPRLALPAAGLAVAGLAVALHGRLAAPNAGEPADPPDDAAAESLRRWRAQTETLIGWADSSRGDWDRHLRPRLAREFALVTDQREPAAQAATGRMLFGEDLWQWVDPRNVTRTGRDQPGPGRAALGEILRRLDRI